MKIGIQTWGSDGDIFPFLSLARGLSASGHDVTVVYTSVDNKEYSAYAQEFGISLIRAYGDFDGESARIFNEITATRDAFKELSLILENFFEPAIEEMYGAAKKLCRENDLVVGHAIHYPLAIAAEKAHCPRVSVALCPMAIESKYVSPYGTNLGTWLNSLLWKLGDWMMRKKVYRAADTLRVREGLGPFTNMLKELYVTRDLTLIATARPLCPRPPDWGDNIQICGFLNPQHKAADWRMPEELRTFLDYGAPPVYCTFGSCTQFDLEGTTRLFIEAVEKAGVRAIIQSDWDNLPEMAESPNIYKVRSIPHEHVFPLCAMIVHHGGSGTTQASLLAGKPSIVVAHGFDQPYWGKTLHRIGAGGKLLYRRSITPEMLAQEIRAVLNSPPMASKARNIGQAIAGEDGVARAVASIEERFV